MGLPSKFIVTERITIMKSKKLIFALAALTAAVGVSAKIISKNHRNDYINLEDYFHFNRTDSIGHLPEHYSPFYYGNHLNAEKPIMLNRRNFSIPTNHLLCGIAGTGKTALMEHEIQSALFKTNDRVFVITSTNDYYAIADRYDGVIKIDKESKPIYIPDDKRLVVCSLEKIRYENQSLLSEYYLKCLETVWKHVCDNVNPERLSWIFIDDIQDIMCDKRCMSLLTDIIKQARPYGCTVTLSVQSLYNLVGNDIVDVEWLLSSINLLTLFSLGIKDKKFILSHYKDILSESDILFLEKLCSKIQHGKGLYVVNGRLVDDNNLGNLSAIPFDIKL